MTWCDDGRNRERQDKNWRNEIIKLAVKFWQRLAQCSDSKKRQKKEQENFLKTKEEKKWKRKERDKRKEKKRKEIEERDRQTDRLSDFKGGRAVSLTEQGCYIMAWLAPEIIGSRAPI